MPVTIPLLRTALRPCSYLPDQVARDALVAESHSGDTRIAGILNRHGFRRSGDYFYRPDCPVCQACEAVRIGVADFQYRRSWRRLQTRNADLQVHRPAGIDGPEYFALFARYIDSRHADGSMAPAEPDSYRHFLCQPPGPYTFFAAFRDDRQRLLAVMVGDAFEDGLSAVYSFYDPAETRRSLGSWMLLWLLGLADTLGLPYVYPGFYVSRCRKMAYKARFGPLETYRDGRWQPFAGPGL